MNDITIVPRHIYAVIDTAGQPIHSSTWPEACHEHINELLDLGSEEAGQYVVREYKLNQ